MNIPAPWPADIELRATRAAAAASHRRQVGAAVVALRNARERWAPVAALANEDMHHDRRLWQAPSVAEVAAAARVDFDAAMQDGLTIEHERESAVTLDANPTLAHALRRWCHDSRCGSQRRRRPCFRASYWRP